MSYLKDIDSVDTQANMILNQTLNIHIQKHLIDDGNNRIKYLFIYLIRKHSIFLFLMYAANFRFLHVLHFFEDRLASFFVFLP